MAVGTKSKECTKGMRRTLRKPATLALVLCAGLIGYRRGGITILDRRGLEEASCECYESVRREYERLIGPL